ncbi:extracellular solute-binding protein [Sheuella amnicola]
MMSIFKRTASLSHFNRISAALASTLMAAGMAHANPVEIEVWHTLNDSNTKEFESIAKQFNNEQNETRVVLKRFENQEAMTGPKGRAQAASRKPNLIQLQDNRSPEHTAQHKELMPMHELLKQYPIADQKWFLPSATGFVRDSNQRLLAFPFMAEIPVMVYNTDAYKKAGLDPAKPPVTWIALQGDLIAVRDKADFFDCPYATSQQVTIHLENLAPLNDTQYVTPDNGLVSVRQPMLNFDSTYMRHLSIMVSWTRSNLLTFHTNDNAADDMFAKKKCAVLTTGSGSIGQLLNTRDLKFAVASLPHYEQVSRVPGKPFVSGSALWAASGHSKEQNKATVAFLAYLAKPVIASAWHQKTGFLPLTDAAFRTADVAFYDRVPGARKLVQDLSTGTEKNSRGFRINNYPKVEAILDRELNSALKGNTPPVAALNISMEESKPLMTDPKAPVNPAPAKSAPAARKK